MAGKEFGDGAFDAIESYGTVMAWHVAPFVAWRSERKAAEQIRRKFEALTRIAGKCRADEERRLAHLPVNAPAHIVDPLMRVRCGNAVSKQRLVQCEDQCTRVCCEHSAQSGLDRDQWLDFIIAIPSLPHDILHRPCKRHLLQNRLGMPLDQRPPQAAIFKRAADRVFELAAQLTEDVDGRLPIPGLVEGFGWRHLPE